MEGEGGREGGREGGKNEWEGGRGCSGLVLVGGIGMSMIR